VQVFEHQHQRRLGGQHLEDLGELAQHAGRGRPQDLALETFQLRLRQEPWQLHQPHRRIPP
jgi:hypothetical protein